MFFRPILILLTPVFAFFARSEFACDLETSFGNDRLVSIEENSKISGVILSGWDRPTLTTTTPPNSQTLIVIFDFFMTYKGSNYITSQYLKDDKKVSVTFEDHLCKGSRVPNKYLVFVDLEDEKLVAKAAVKWNAEVDRRVWISLGWTEWSEWSSCSVTCGNGIQQRSRFCNITKCEGHNVEQRHCNLFECAGVANPLAADLVESFFHPAGEERPRRAPDRPAAWRLAPTSYVWLPAARLFQRGGGFPGEFVLFLALRIRNSSTGTIFSLRSRRREDSYLSLELSEFDLKLIHVNSNGTEVVRIGTPLGDERWHQITISFRDNSIIETYIDCVWSTTCHLRDYTFDIPEDSDIIIGYLFSGDLEQLSITSNVSVSNLQCEADYIPIREDSLMYLR